MATSSLSLQFREAWRVFQHYLQKTRFSLATGPPRRTPQGWGPNLPVRSKAKCDSKANDGLAAALSECHLELKEDLLQLLHDLEEAPEPYLSANRFTLLHVGRMEPRQ